MSGFFSSRFFRDCSRARLVTFDIDVVLSVLVTDLFSGLHGIAA